MVPLHVLPAGGLTVAPRQPPVPHHPSTPVLLELSSPLHSCCCEGSPNQESLVRLLGPSSPSALHVVEGAKQAITWVLAQEPAQQRKALRCCAVCRQAPVISLPPLTYPLLLGRASLLGWGG